MSEMKKSAAFMLGVFGFAVALFITVVVYAVVSESYRSGYDAGYKCAKYQICIYGESR